MINVYYMYIIKASVLARGFAVMLSTHYFPRDVIKPLIKMQPCSIFLTEYQLHCASISSSSCSRSLLSWLGLSRVTLGQFEDLARLDFTRRPIYEGRSSALHTSFPHRCLTAVCLSWICNRSHLGKRLRFRCGGRQTEWVQARWAVTNHPPP